MAAAAAAGGLLIAAAGAVPAYASAASAPAGGHTITITAHPRAGGIGPPRDPAVRETAGDRNKARELR